MQVVVIVGVVVVPGGRVDHANAIVAVALLQHGTEDLAAFVVHGMS